MLNNMFLVEIIDMFEDFLTAKGVTIPNEERDAEDPDGSQIWGMDFADVLGNIRDICGKYGIDVADEW
jgi:hypothetical protein